MKRTFTDYLQDIIDNCDRAASFVEDVSLEQFQENPEKVYAVVRAVEIVGEAARHIPKSLRDKYPAIPWSKATGIRDRVVHNYFEVALQITFKNVHQELPPLRRAIQAMLDDLNREQMNEK